MIIDLFEDWLRMFGSKLKERQQLDLRTAELWALALKNSGLTLAEFKLASEKSLNLRWPPTAAQDFIDLVRGDMSTQYPDMRQAYLDAANGNYSAHAVIFETAHRVGFWDLKSKAESVTFKSWQQHYPKVCSEHASGAQFALPKERQLSYSHTPMSNDSPMAATVDEFLNRFKRKHGSLA